MSIISERLKVIKPSPTLAVAAKAASMKQSGIDIISLSTGEPDFDTPNNIKKSAIAAIDAGFTKYTNVDGTPSLKKAVQNKLLCENNLSYDLNQIIISTGGKQVIYNLFMASLNPGDEVLIPAPYWVSYPDIVSLAEGTPVIIETNLEAHFKISPQQLESAITDKTKWLIINSPSNPTGSVYSGYELKAIANILRKYPDIQIMSDDIYEHIIFGEQKFVNIANVAPDLKDRVFIVNGVSKSYSMTGWRIGYGAGKTELIKAMTIIQSQCTSNASSISQAAAEEALSGTQDFMAPNCAHFFKKRNEALDILKNVDGLEIYVAQGAFYLFIRCTGFLKKKTEDGYLIEDSDQLCQYLLDKALVAVVPGSGFGLPGYFRISYATEKLSEACRRIKQALELLL